MLFKIHGDDAMDLVEMDTDRQAYEDQAEYNATQHQEWIEWAIANGVPSEVVDYVLAPVAGGAAPLDDTIPF